MNTWGRLLRLTTWGESHGTAIGGVVDGFPAGFELDLDAIGEALRKRAPGQSTATSPRRESDQVEFLSGIFEGRTTGVPIAFLIRNNNQHSHDYEALRHTYRPGHADLAYQEKYGHRDHRGGGRSSARETALIVVAGAMARQWLERHYQIEIFAYADSIGQAQRAETLERYPHSLEALRSAKDSLLRQPDPAFAEAMLREIETARHEGDSVGGIVACIATNIPPSWGEPIYDKIEARLAEAMLSINAVRGFEIGEGFGSAQRRGSEHNDAMYLNEANEICYYSNHAGGTLGGISTGQDLRMRVAFKPTPSISRPQRTLPEGALVGAGLALNPQGNTLQRAELSGQHSTEGEDGICKLSPSTSEVNTPSERYQILEIKGRHDSSVVVRAIPVVEAMCALVLMDMALLSTTHRHSPASQ